MKKPICKEAFEHRDEFEYVGSGWGYHMNHKIHAEEYVYTFEWKGWLFHCLTDDNTGDAIKVLECFGRNE